MNRDDTWPYFVVLCAIGGLIMLFSSPATDPEGSNRALTSSGFTDVELSTGGWFDCGRDAYTTHFKATNPIGMRVEGVVCCGIMKNCTVRF